MNNEKNKTKPAKSTVNNSADEDISRYMNSDYFNEKDKKAIEFLKKHPIPEKFLK